MAARWRTFALPHLKAGKTATPGKAGAHRGHANVAIFSEGFAIVAERFLRKGSKELYRGPAPHPQMAGPVRSTATPPGGVAGPGAIVDDAGRP